MSLSPRSAISMMRLARIVCVASELDASVSSLPRPCKNAQASSNATQIVRVLLKLNASGFSTMTQTPHASHASVREGRTLKGVLRCSGLKARSLCDGGSITRRLRSPQSEVELQFCDDPQIAHALRRQNAADGCRIPLTNVVGSHAQETAPTGTERTHCLVI